MGGVRAASSQIRFVDTIRPVPPEAPLFDYGPSVCSRGKKKIYKRDKRARLGSGAGNVKVNTQTQSLTPPPVGVRLSALQRPAPSHPLF